MTCFNGENREGLEFENDKITSDGPSNPDKSNADKVSSDEDVNAHFQGEHVHNDISDLLSSTTEDSDKTANTDESSNSVETSNADEITQSAGSTKIVLRTHFQGEPQKRLKKIH